MPGLLPGLACTTINLARKMVPSDGSGDPSDGRNCPAGSRLVLREMLRRARTAREIAKAGDGNKSDCLLLS
jgi:hypothetical protein